MTLKSEVASQLEDCLAVVFPNVPKHELSTAAIGSTPGWDSLATLTLVSVVEETFQISVPLDDLEKFLSFELILEYVTQPKLRAAA